MRKIYAQTSPRLLGEIPRFFTSFKSVLAEIFQNAYRAGAENVFVRYDKDKHLLTISDDGPGLSDPQRLITAGDTGWNEAEIVDPAGMGAFSVLREDLVKKIQYESHGAGNWRMTLTANILSGEAVDVEQLPANNLTGLTLMMWLQPAITIEEELIAIARARYPYRVVYTSSDRINTIAPCDVDWAETTIEAATGTIYWQYLSRWNITRRFTEVVWEYRDISSQLFRQKLLEAASKYKFPVLATMIIERGNIMFWPKANSSIRPKLPDRNELIDNQELQVAAELFVSELVTHFLDRTRQAIKSWPDTFVISRWGCPHNNVFGAPRPQIDDAVLEKLFDNEEDAFAEILNFQGWHKAQEEDLSLRNWYYSGDEVECEEFTMKGYTKKPACITSSPSLNLSLLNQGCLSILESSAPVTTGHIEHMACSSDCIWVAFADRIHIDGVGDIEYLINTELGSEDIGLALTGIPNSHRWWEYPIIFAGTPEEFLKKLAECDVFENVAMGIKNSIDGLFDIMDESDEFDREELRREIELDVTSTYFPALKDARSDVGKLQRSTLSIDEIIRKTRSVGSAINCLTQKNQTLQNRVETIIEQMLELRDECTQAGEQLDKSASLSGKAVQPTT